MQKFYVNFFKCGINVTGATHQYGGKINERELRKLI